MQEQETEQKEKVLLQTRHWEPCAVEYLVKYCRENQYEKILEVGPGSRPFPLATHFVGHLEEQETNDGDNTVKVDVDLQTLPYRDNEFDFVYARHVLEDLNAPWILFQELQRVSKNGYVETPSPLAEITKHVDCLPISHLYKGYVHHRYFVWVEDQTLMFLPKYPIIEHINFPTQVEQTAINYLNTSPIYWNTYYMWNKNNSDGSAEENFKVLHQEKEYPFMYGTNAYVQTLFRGIDAAVKNCETWKTRTDASSV